MTQEPRRGRPRVRRMLRCDRTIRCFGPLCHLEDPLESVILLPEEIELLRLIDLEGLDQEEAAATLGVSRRTVWRDLHEARRKVTDALVNGKNINMHECKLKAEGRCPKQQ